jgi:hypothetical protein
MMAAALTIGFGLAGCGTVDDALFGADSALFGSSDQGAAESQSSDQSQAATTPGTLPGTMPGAAPSAVGGGTMAAGGIIITPVSIEPGSDTGTAVSKTVAALRGQLSGLQNTIVTAAQSLSNLKDAAAGYAGSYQGAKAQITTRLQIGTTRGNPELVSQWNVAQSALDSLSGNINALSALGTEIANDASTAHYVLSTAQATMNVSGAVDEDHRQLTVLEDEAQQTIVLTDRLLHEVSDDIQRQTAYVGNERANLTTLAAAIKDGELYGSNLGTAMEAAPASYGVSGAGGTPLVTIRFDHAHVDYKQILYSALAQALQAQPSASFAVVAVSPTRGTVAAVQLAQSAAQRHAQEVLRSMTDMGVPGARLSVSSSTDPTVSGPQVRVFVR